VVRGAKRKDGHRFILQFRTVKYRGECVAQRRMTPFVLYVIVFALGITSFVISVLPAASYNEIGALLAIEYSAWVSPG
jgi:hypothetical protein